MTTPAQIQRPWQFCLNNRLTSTPTAATWPPQFLGPIAGKNSMLALKNILKGSGTWTDLEGDAATSAGNWTVVSSCDGSGGAGSFGNRDNMDRWADTGDLIWANPASNHSWIVLAQPGISPNFEICIDLVTTNEYNCTVVMAPNQQFGAVGGGTNGTDTARPTAGTSGTGEVVVLSAGAYGALGDIATQSLHVLKSSDGSATRVLFTRNGFIGGAWFLEVPANTPDGWEYPVVGAITANSTANISSSVVESSQLLITPIFKGLSKYPSGAVWTAFLSTPNGAGYAYADTYVPEDVGGAPMFHPASLLVKSALTTIGMRGTYGSLVDCYYPPNCAADGLTYPADGSRQWVQTGRLVMPWNKSANLWY